MLPLFQIQICFECCSTLASWLILSLIHMYLTLKQTETDFFLISHCLVSVQVVGIMIGAGVAIVLIAVLIFFVLRRMQLRS